MRASVRWALAGLLVAGGAIVACTATNDRQVSVTVAPSIVFPRGVLDLATTLNLTVYAQSAGVSCNAATGLAGGVTGTTPKIASQTLGTANCAGGAKFCGSLNITKSADVLVFSAAALSSSGGPVANGCATATVNQDTLDVQITMVHFLPPATCGNGIIEPTEQCDPPGAADAGAGSSCDPQCHSREIVLSTGAAAPQGPAFFLWPAQSGDSGRFFGFFTTSAANLDVAMRVMSDALLPVTTPAAAASAMIAPNDPNVFPPAPAPNNQSQAAAAFVNNTYYYVFVDDDQAVGQDIHLRSFDHQLAANEGLGAPIAVNGAEINKQTHPSVAVGPGGLLFIAWQDENGPNAGQVMGRTYNPSGGLGTENQISSGTGNESVRVAATASGWIAVWDNGSQIKLRVISGSGSPSGPEITVSDATHTGAQDRPGIAVLGDGRAAIVWADHGTATGSDIFVQRYDANVTPVAGDQARAINDVHAAGDQIAPTIAATSAAGGSFVAAWLDSATNHVRARVLGGSSGFLFNSVDGQTSEFQASLADGPARANPTIAIGGAGPWVAIGWDDGASISARRFPAPTN